MHRVMIILSIFVLLVSLKTTAPEPYNLKLFTDDFRKLSRVTNAIHLQSVFAEKDFNIQDFLSEVLEITPDRFEFLMSLSIEPARLELNRIFKMHGETMANNNTDHLNVYINALNVLESVEANQDLLSNASNLLPNFIFDAARGVEKYPLLNGPCLKVDHLNLQKFRRLFPRDEESFELPENSEINKTLVQFQPNSLQFIKCLQSFETLDNSSDTLQSLYDEYQLVKESFKIAFDFASNYEPIENLDSTIENVYQELHKTRKVWQQSSKNQDLDKIIGHLRISVVSYEEHMIESEYRVNPKPDTAGFKNLADFPNVFEDLNSTWFKNKTRAKNITELTAALKQFKSFFSQISSLGSAWSKIPTNERNQFADLRTINAVEIFENITKFSADSIRNLKTLNDSRGIIQSCIKKPNVNMTKFGEFRRGYQPSESVVTGFLSLSRDMTKIRDHVLYPSLNDKARNQLYQSVITGTVGVIEKRGTEEFLLTLNKIRRFMDNATHQIEKNVLDKKFDFLEGLDRIYSVINKMKELKSASTTLKGKKIIALRQLLDSIDLFNVTKCFEKAKFDVPSILFPFYVHIGLLSMPNEEAIKHINQFLGHLENVQRAFSSVQKSFKKESPKFPKSSSYPNIFNSTTDLKLFNKQLGDNVRFLENLEISQNKLKKLPNISKFPEDIEEMVREKGLKDWADPFTSISQLMTGVEQLNKKAREEQNETLTKMEDVFEEAANLHGIPGDRKAISELHHDLKKSHLRAKKETLQYFHVVHKLDLDFARHQSSLRNSPVILKSLKDYFDEIFGNTKKPTPNVEYVREVSWVTVLGSCIGFMFLLLIGALLLYGWTESGRTKYTNLWLYYFGSQEDFEKRWRYCRFLDYSNGRNTMLEAVREVNKTNLLKALKSGAYINAYNRHGNTALHIATKLGHPELVKILIKHGADRSLPNSQNLTPERMTMMKSSECLSDRPLEARKIQKIFNKYKKRKFRIQVPPKFPESSFHIWIDEGVNVQLSNKFVEKYHSISSDEMSTSTHCVVHTDEHGVLDLTRIDLLSWILNGTIIVKDTWLTDCLTDDALIMEDSKYLVEKVRYKGVIYSTVLAWSEAMAKGAIPYLYGSYVAVVMTEYDNLLAFVNIVESQGGTMMEEFPVKTHFNKNSHPYHHANIGPLFLLHDGKTNLKYYKNDPDKMYTLFTEEEFISLLLKRESNTDKRENLIQVLKTPKK